MAPGVFETFCNIHRIVIEFDLQLTFITIPHVEPQSHHAHHEHEHYDAGDALQCTDSSANASHLGGL
jgi:hypothetical protein